MKSDCVVVNHHEANNNTIVRTPAAFLVPNRSIVTPSPSSLNGYSKQVPKNVSGNGILSTGITQTSPNLNGFNGSSSNQIKPGQFINHILLSNGDSHQAKNKFPNRAGCAGGNPMVLVATQVDNPRPHVPVQVNGVVQGNELHPYSTNNKSKLALQKCDGSIRNFIGNLDAVNVAFNEKNPGAGGLFDASLVTQVNLAAAFHDHISCTKIGNEITKSGGVLSGFNGAPTSRKAPSFQEPEGESSLKSEESKEQIAKMKTMILTHLDLIQHQQEMLLKKDRQLQGLKQDRESLLSRLEKMEKKMSVMGKKIVSLTELSQNNAESNFKSKICEPSKSSGSSGVSSASSSPVFSDYFSSESASNALFIKLTNDQNFKQEDEDSQSSDMMVIKSDGKLSSPAKKRKSSLSPSKSSLRKKNRSELKLDVTSESKCVSKSTSTTTIKKSLQLSRKKQSSTSSSTSSTTSSSLESEKSDVTDVPMTVETTKKQEDIPFNFMTSNDLYEVVNMWDVEELEQEVRKKVMSTFKLRSFANFDPTKCQDNLKALESESGKTGNVLSTSNICTETGSADEIEVPTWRVVPVTGSYAMEGTELLDDELFNKRHSKMEIDERRRKRWDIQRLREQKHNEKLKQGRYYSKAAFVSTDIKYQPTTSVDPLKNEPEPVSFFPDPMDAEVIEVCDTLPLLAFGHPIPVLPGKPFSLPWNPRTKCDRKASQLGSFAKNRNVNDTCHGTQASETLEDYKTMATETTLNKTIMSSSFASKASPSQHQPVSKGAKSICSAKKMTISVT